MAIHSSDSGCRGLRRAIRRRRQWRLHGIRRGRYEGAIAPPVATAILRPPAECHLTGHDPYWWVQASQGGQQHPRRR